MHEPILCTMDGRSGTMPGRIFCAIGSSRALTAVKETKFLSKPSIIDSAIQCYNEFS